MTQQLTNPYFILFTVTFLVNVFLLFLILARWKNAGATMFWFFVLSSLSCAWAFVQIMLCITAGASYTVWYSITELIIALILPVYCCFVLAFVGRENSLKKIPVLVMLVVPACVLLFLYWKTDVITIHDFSRAITTPWGYQFPRQSVIPWDIVIVSLYCFAAIVELVWFFITTKDSLRKTASVFIIFAYLFPIVGGMLFQGIIPAYLHTAEFPAAAPLVLGACIVIAFVLVRYGNDIFEYRDLSSDIISIIPTALIVLDGSQKIQEVNASFMKLIGATREELIGKEFLLLITNEEVRARWKKEIFDQLSAKNSVESVVMDLPQSGGASMSVNVHAIVKKDGKNKPVATVVILTDISRIQQKEQEILATMKRQEEQNATLEDNKKAMLNLLEDSRVLEQDLKIERDRATAIVSSMSEGLFVVDKNYRIVLMNPMAEKMVGVTMDKAAGQPLDKISVMFKGSKELNASERPLRQTLDTGTPITVGLEDEYFFKTADGRLIPLSLSTAALRREGEIIGALETFHDISRDKSVKETIEQTVEERTMQLKEEEARLTASINSLELGFMLTDVDGGILTKNPASSSILNLPWGIKGLKDMDEALHASFSFMELHNKARNDHKPADKRNISLAGKFIDIFVAPIYVGGRDEDFIGSALLIQDQTESKVLERSRDEFFSIASHELRTPLTAIRGNTSLIQEHYSEKLDPELKEMVNDIHDSSIRLIDIVNDFLNMGRLEQQRIDFKNESFVIEDLITAAMKEYEVTGSRQHLSLEFVPPPKPMPRVFADKDRIRQVIINLIGNSLKFTTIGGVKISVRENDGMVEVSVTDTGRGIPLQNQALLFHKFQQAGDSLFTRDTTKGTGLGLYISKLMVEAMGGKIWLVRSEEGKGSEFAFTLPLAKTGAL
jgi:PAS domain S-box-containing protein